MGTQHEYKVRLFGKLIDKVFYNTKKQTQEVYWDLVNHDGYDPRIEITKPPIKKITNRRIEDEPIKNKSTDQQRKVQSTTDGCDDTLPGRRKYQWRVSPTG